LHFYRVFNKFNGNMKLPLFMHLEVFQERRAARDDFLKMLCESPAEFADDEG